MINRNRRPGVHARGGDWHETETMYMYARPPVPINDTLCLMYISSASLGFSPFDRYARPPVPINDTLCLMYIGSASLGYRRPGVPVKGREP
jgi:hypothetical protein